MLGQYSAACTYKMEFKYACSGRESYISLKQSYSQTKTHLLSPNRDPCVTILSVTV